MGCWADRENELCAPGWELLISVFIVGEGALIWLHSGVHLTINVGGTASGHNIQEERRAKNVCDFDASSRSTRGKGHLSQSFMEISLSLRDGKCTRTRNVLTFLDRDRSSRKKKSKPAMLDNLLLCCTAVQHVHEKQN